MNANRSLALATAVVLAACGGGGGGPSGGGGYGGNDNGSGDDGASGDVAMRDDFFQPEEVTIERGTTLIWANQGQNVHSARPDDGTSWNDEDVAPNGTFSVRFDEAGEYPYHCRYHGAAGGVDMAGTVIVE